MSTPHPDIGPELRRLAQAILDRLDPAVRAAATMATETLSGPGRCQQVWCPVCALAALVSGEQHPLLVMIADHSVALMAVIRTMAADPATAATSEPPPPGDRDHSDSTATDRRYQDIPIIVEPVTDEE
ncbi:MAG: hypothetical protein ACOYO2_02670 [Mycobacterium sp.]